MIPAFKFHLNNPILERLAKVGYYDGKHPSLTCGTSSGKVFIHSPHERNQDFATDFGSEVDGDADDSSNNSVRFLNINRQVSALTVGKFRPTDAGDTLIIGTQTNILGIEVDISGK